MNLWNAAIITAVWFSLCASPLILFLVFASSAYLNFYFFVWRKKKYSEIGPDIEGALIKGGQ
jgi:hypothetical protein